MKSQVSHTSSSWVQDHCLTAWVQNDPRSAAAMLRGNGDDRFALYEQFVEIKMKESPQISLEEINDEYAVFMKKREMEWNMKAKIPTKFQVVLNVLNEWVYGHLIPILAIGLGFQWLVKHF